MGYMSVTEQRYQAELAAIGEGRTVSGVVSSGKWIGAGCIGDLPTPDVCPVEVLVLELRRTPRYWGARRLALDLHRRQVEPFAGAPQGLLP
jgi:hypothetical protein